MGYERWNDDRLDDLHAAVQNIAETQTTILRTVDAHDRDLALMGKTGDRRAARRWDLTLLAIGQVVTILLVIFHH